MKSTPKKVGRKAATWHDSQSGDPIVGLSRRPSDGRWRVIATGECFTEPDERFAIARFLRMTGQTDGPASGTFAMHVGKADWPEYDAATSAKIVELDETNKYGEINVPMALVYAIVRRELIDNPKAFAAAVGIEELGYLTNIKPPEKLPTLDELETIWKTHAKIDKKQIKKVVNAFKHFRKATGLETIAQITPELVVSYRDILHESEYSSKTQSHMCGAIRRILTFAKSRAIAVTKLTECLTYLSILTPKDTITIIDPQPIGVDDFHAMLKVATSGDKAMILMMLNGAFSMQEVIRLRWDDIDQSGCIVTNRHKTGRCIRICVLWAETLAALEEVKRNRQGTSETIFNSYHGTQLSISGAHLRFEELRTKAKCEHVCSNHLRDGSYTAAVESNVSGDLCRLLAGHRTGMADHYVARKPQMVAPACEAIHTKYFSTDPVTMKIAG